MQLPLELGDRIQVLRRARVLAPFGREAGQDAGGQVGEPAGRRAGSGGRPAPRCGQVRRHVNARYRNSCRVSRARGSRSPPQTSANSGPWPRRGLPSERGRGTAPQGVSRLCRPWFDRAAGPGQRLARRLQSPFEEAVASGLEARGWALVPQVGISGFRIDIGVRHPDLDGAYLAGVKCDGAAYHASATARDRDKVREQVLRGLG